MATFPERKLGNITIANSTPVNFKLDRVAAYRWILLRFVLNLTTGATAPTYKEDALLRYFKKIKITRDGSDVKFDCSAKTTYYLAEKEKGTTPFKTDPTSATSTTADAILDLRIDFATNRINDKDVSALLKAKGLAQLDLDITFGDNSDLASANAPTINLGAAVSYVEVYCKEVIGEVVTSDDKVVDVLDSDPIDYYELERLIPLDNAAHVSMPNDTQKENVTPAPANLTANLFIVEDSSQNKSDAILTDIVIQKEVGNVVNIINRGWKSLREEQKTELQQESLATGVVLLDYIDRLGAGLLNDGNEGDIKYRFLKASSTSAQIRLFTRSVAA